MAVQMMSTIQRWEGLSTDNKPGEPGGAAAPTFVGSTFYETDTGRTYLWVGVLPWAIMPVHILNVQGGAYTLQDLMEEWLASMDFGGGEALTLLMDGNEQILYEYPAAADVPGIHPFYFAGLKIDWTGLNFGAGENNSIRFYEIVNGTNLRLVSTEVFLAAALPVPVITFHPRNAATDIQPTPGYYRQGLRITAQQAGVGGGWNTLTYSMIDAIRGG